MDRRLFEAAQTGNTQYLHQLLAENPFLLHTISLSSSDNPLFVASLAGDDHVDFVKEILRLKPDFSKQFNEDGFSLIHIASANGYLEILRELLRVDRKLCRLEGRNKWSPLHFAASRGKVEIIREVLVACPESIEDVNLHKESALHIAVKNGQYEAISVMVEIIKEMKKDDVLNMKDEYGNSVLHLATWKKQRQVIELLLGYGTSASDEHALALNDVNQSGLTALDLLHIFPSEAGDREIEEILRNAGAKRARDTALHLFNSFQYENQTQVNDHSTQPARENDLEEYFKFKKGRDSPSDARSSLLVMAVLVATATFQAGINPPCGVWKDSDLNGREGTPKHQAGRSVLGSYSPVFYLIFVILNSIGLSLSLYMLTILTSHFSMQFEFQICIIALYFTYNTAVATMAPDNLRLFIIVFTSVLPNVIYHSTKRVKQLMKKLLRLLANLVRRCR
ncbi:hypothetical protein UlMin_026303 [Ulmus minor]